MNAIQRLVVWFQSQCDGDWEHGDGIVIESMDNPGWWIKIAVEGTELDEKEFSPVTVRRTEADWISAARVQGIVDIQCGSGNLEEAVALFCDWAGA